MASRISEPAARPGRAWGRAARLSIAAALLAAAALCLLLAPAAGAHALLLKSVPAANATLSSAPTTITCIFTEPPDPRLSQIQVVDAKGRPVPGASKAHPVAGQPDALQVTLSQKLAKGVYTVNWLSLSTIDGHVTGGSFAFGIGSVVPSSRPPTAALGNASWLVSAASTAGRWLLDVGLGLLVGAATAALLVFRGLPTKSLATRGHLLLRVSWGLAMLGLVVVMEAERSAVGLSSLLPLFGSAAGWPLVLEGIAVLVAGVALVVVELWPAPRTIAILGAAAAAAMFLHAYAGHAAGPSPARALNLFEQWLHLLAFGVWIGGLAWLLYGARGQPHNQTAAAVRRFSLLAGYALAAVAVTGGLRAISEVGAARNLLVTPFGLVLLVKVGIFLGLALLGAVNHYRSVPALLRGVRSRFVWNSRAELLLAVSVVGLAGYLGGLSPANQAAAAGASPPNQLVVSGADYGLTVRVRLTITPGVVGANEFTVQVTDYASGQPTPARGVQLLFTLPAKPSVGASSLTLKQAAAGTWKGRGLELSIAGDWTCQVLVQEAANAVVVPLTIHAALP